MKNRLLSLVLLALTSPLLFSSQPNAAPTPLMQEETRFIGTLYWNKKNAASFAKNLTDAELNYAIYVLSKNIPLLQNNLLPENLKKGKLLLMAAGGLFAMLYGGAGSVLAYDAYKEHYEYITGRFKNVFISEAKYNNLSSVHISPKEKRYLRRFKAENIIIGDWWRGASQWYQERTQEIMSEMSRRDKEKLTYCALKETVACEKRRLLQSMFHPAIFIIGAIALSAITLCGVIYHKENLENQLEDCKNLYRIINDEKESRLSLAQKRV